jgi:hypothetical protein
MVSLSPAPMLAVSILLRIATLPENTLMVSERSFPTSTPTTHLPSKMMLPDGVSIRK